MDKETDNKVSLPSDFKFAFKAAFDAAKFDENMKKYECDMNRYFKDRFAKADQEMKKYNFEVYDRDDPVEKENQPTSFAAAAEATKAWVEKGMDKWFWPPYPDAWTLPPIDPKEQQWAKDTVEKALPAFKKEPVHEPLPPTKIELFFSAENAKKFGSTAISVPDGNGGEKKILYTGVLDWPAPASDQVPVWSGTLAELRDLRNKVATPIVIDATTAEGARPFVDFVKSLECHSSTQTAAAESQRIQPYFAAMSAYLTEVLQKSDPVKQWAGYGLTTRGALSGLFNAMAAKARTTITAEVAILPDNINNTGPAAGLFTGSEFNAGYDYCGHMFNFGFFKVQHNITDRMARSNTVFPIFRIDHRMMDKVPAAQLKPLLADFQKLMTFVNHDMLHHFTSPVIGANTAEHFGQTGQEVSHWADQIPYSGQGETYEHWAQMGQERVWLSHEDPVRMADIRATLDRYFDGLKHVGETLMQGAGPASPEEKKQQAHEVVDFFGMVMAHALTRVFPLNHPVMTHCLNLLQQADPDPQQAVVDCWHEMKMAHASKDELVAFLARKLPNPPSPSALLLEIRYLPSLVVEDVIQSYRAQGFDMLPKNDAAVGYAQLKLLSLAQLGTDDVRPHVPVPQDTDMAQLRSEEDQQMLDMVIAAAMTAQYKPS